MSDFKPSDIDLGRVGFPPLVATFEKTECEIAATLMLRAMDDEWCGVEWVEVQTLAKADLAACKDPLGEPTPVQRLIRAIVTNPICRPDVYRLVEKGYATWEGAPGVSPVAFTDKGKDKLRRWARTP